MTESAKKLGGAWSGNGLGLPCIQKKMKISLYLCLLQDFKPACIQGGKFACAYGGTVSCNEGCNLVLAVRNWWTGVLYWNTGTEYLNNH